VLRAGARGAKKLAAAETSGVGPEKQKEPRLLGVGKGEAVFAIVLKEEVSKGGRKERDRRRLRGARPKRRKKSPSISEEKVALFSSVKKKKGESKSAEKKKRDRSAACSGSLKKKTSLFQSLSFRKKRVHPLHRLQRGGGKGQTWNGRSLHSRKPVALTLSSN